MLGGAWLADLLLDTAPRIPFRNLATLQDQHPGLGADDLAEALISGAAKASGSIGAAGGALAAVEFAAPPFLLTAPVQLAAETLLVAAVEVKLIAELHEVYGAAVPGSLPVERMAYVMAWTERRGIDPLRPRCWPPGRRGEAGPAQPADPPGGPQPDHARPPDVRRRRRQHGQPPRDPPGRRRGPQRPAPPARRCPRVAPSAPEPSAP